MDKVLSKANSLLKNRQLTEAISEYSTIITSHASDREILASAYNNRGQCRYFQVEFYKAIDDYSLSLTHKPNNAVTLFNRAQVTYRLNNFSEAKIDILKALSLEPDFEDAKLCLEAIENENKKTKKTPTESS